MPALVGAWPAAVGETVAANAWPARVARDGTLHVHASSSAWAFELQQLEPEIAGRLREAVLGGRAPPRLRFAPGPLPELAGRFARGRSETAAGADARARREARELVAAIADEELRKSVARAAAVSLASAADGRSA